MRFEEMLPLLRSGEKVVRRKCFVPHLYIAYLPEMVVQASNLSERALRFWPANKNMPVWPQYIKIYGGTSESGWRPTAMDMDANDWEVFDPKQAKIFG